MATTTKRPAGAAKTTDRPAGRTGAAPAAKAPMQTDIAEHPTSPAEVLTNVELASRIMNENLAQQNAIHHGQALANLRLAVVAKCADLILSIDPRSPDAGTLLKQYKELMELFMDRLAPR